MVSDAVLATAGYLFIQCGHAVCFHHLLVKHSLGTSVYGIVVVLYCILTTNSPLLATEGLSDALKISVLTSA